MTTAAPPRARRAETEHGWWEAVAPPIAPALAPHVVSYYGFAESTAAVERRRELPIGAVVMINTQAKAVTSLSSAELRELAGKHSSQIRQALGPDRRDVAAVPEDIIFLEETT